MEKWSIGFPISPTLQFSNSPSPPAHAFSASSGKSEFKNCRSLNAGG